MSRCFSLNFVLMLYKCTYVCVRVNAPRNNHPDCRMQSNHVMDTDMVHHHPFSDEDAQIRVD